MLLSDLSSSFSAIGGVGHKTSTLGTRPTLPSSGKTGLSSWSILTGPTRQSTPSKPRSRMAQQSHRMCCFKSDVRFTSFTCLQFHFKMIDHNYHPQTWTDLPSSWKARALWRSSWTCTAKELLFARWDWSSLNVFSYFSFVRLQLFENLWHKFCW